MSLSPEIQKIRDKLTTRGWPKFVNQIRISGIHGFNSEAVEFKFPLCAIVGENGTGKSTILKALASVYRSSLQDDLTLYPASFFPDTAWEKITGAKISYMLREGTASIQGTLRKNTTRWRGLPDRRLNAVYYFDINRLRSIDAVVGYAKIAKRAVNEIQSSQVDATSVADISQIMNKRYLAIRQAVTDADERKPISVINNPFGDASEFHQGSGESIATAIISTLSKAPDNSLVLIDELESSLHPRSQRHMIRKLLEFTRTKNLQVVITTHSPYVLEELPPDSRILLARNSAGRINVIYGASAEFCMSTIDENLHPELTVCVEDIEARAIVVELIRSCDSDFLSRVNVSPVGGANVVQILAQIAGRGDFPYKLVGILDGDQTIQPPALKIPGTTAIEKEVFSYASKEAVTVETRIGVNAARFKAEVDAVMTDQNHHNWCSLLAARLGLTEDRLWGDLAFLWVNSIPNAEKQKFVDAIKSRL